MFVAIQAETPSVTLLSVPVANPVAEVPSTTQFHKLEVKSEPRKNWNAEVNSRKTIGVEECVGKTMDACWKPIMFILSLLTVPLVFYSYMIMGNNVSQNVFKYPAIKTMIGSDDNPNQVVVACTITSCFGILEANIQPAYVEYPRYDMRQIDKNTYTASSCQSLPANYGPGLPAEANYCEICGKNSGTNLAYLIVCSCLPYIITAVIFLLAINRDKFAKPTNGKAFSAFDVFGILVLWALFSLMFGMSVKVWQNVKACKSSIADFLLIVYASEKPITSYGIGMYIYGWGTISLGIFYALGSLFMFGLVLLDCTQL